MIFRKLKRVWRNNDMCFIPNFHQTFPELNHLTNNDMCDRFNKLGINWYSEEKVAAPGWIRLTLPLALIVWVLLVVGIPFAYIITGKWGYSLGEARVLNWFRSLGLA